MVSAVKIRNAAFKGEIPKLHPRLLPGEAAQTAINTRLENGALVPLRVMGLVHTFASAVQSFYRTPSGNWLGWNADVNAVPGPVAQDRTYTTGQAVPRVLAQDQPGGDLDFPLAVPTPTGAPTVEIIDRLEITPPEDQDVVDDLAEEVTFAVTYVTVLDEESKPSPLSAPVLVSPNVRIRLGISKPVDTGRGISAVRFYRSQTDALGETNLHFIREMALDDIAFYWFPVIHDVAVDTLKAIPPPLPAPANAVVLDRETGSLEPGAGVLVHYTYSYTSPDFASESPESPISDKRTLSPEMTASLTFTISPPASVNRIRVYRYEDDGVGTVTRRRVAILQLSEVVTPWIHSMTANPPAVVLPAPGAPIKPVIQYHSGSLGTAMPVTYSYSYISRETGEGPRSPESDLLEIGASTKVRIRFNSVAPFGNSIETIRIYRVQGDTRYFVMDVPANESVQIQRRWTHLLSTYPLQETISTVDFDEPPGNLKGIIACANGTMAAFVGKNLYFSEPYKPHAWPVKYGMAVEFDIVGLAAIGTAIVVMTKGVPYVIEGSHPEVMIQTRIEQNLPCLTAKGIVDLGFAVAYPSTEGLVTISPSTGANLVTRSLFTREQWSALNAATFNAGQHMGRYIVSHTPEGAAVQSILMIDMTGEQPFIIRSDEDVQAMFFEIGTGRLFLRRGSVQIFEWDKLNQAKKAQIWRSRLYNLPGYVNFGAILIEADEYAGPVAGNEVRIYADGVLTNTISQFNSVERLSSGFLAVRWEIEVRGKLTVTSITLAGSPTEIGTVG